MIKLRIISTKKTMTTTNYSSVEINSYEYFIYYLWFYQSFWIDLIKPDDNQWIIKWVQL